MSLTVDVLLLKSRLPTAEQWQDMISSNGFALRFGDSVDLVSDRGFLPCELGDLKTGIVLDVDELEDTMYDTEEQNGFDCCVGFTVPATLGNEGRSAAIILAATLAEITNGMLAIEGEPLRQEGPIDWANEALGERS